MIFKKAIADKSDKLTTLLLKVALVILAFLAVGCFVFKKEVALAHDGESHELTIIMYDSFYEPKDVNIETGTRVTFINKGQELHWPASDIHPTHAILPEFDTKAGIAPGEEFTYTFNKPGLWRYHDHLFPEIVGDITVSGDAITTKKSFCLCALENLFGKSDTDSEYSYEITPVEKESLILDDKDATSSYVVKFGLQETANKLYAEAGSHGSCHDIAHIAGRVAYEEVGDEIFAQHIPECHSGTIHGATEAYFAKNGTENIDESLNAICNSDEQEYYTNHECLHGVGHGLMAWTAYDIHEALGYCKDLSEGQLSCSSGVFMENVVGGLSGLSGHTTKFLSDDPHMPCNVVDEVFASECYKFQTSRMLSVLDRDWGAIIKECGGLQDEENLLSCFNSLGRDFASTHSTKDSSNFCYTVESYSVEVANMCLRGVSHLSYLSPDQSKEMDQLCSSLKDDLYISSCYGVMFSRLTSYYESSEEIERLCSSINQNYQIRCLEYISF